MKDFASFGAGLNFGALHPLCGSLRRLHPAVKIATLPLGIASITASTSISGLLLVLLFCLTAAALSGIAPSVLLKPILPVSPVIFVVLLIHVLTLPHGAGEGLLSQRDAVPALILLLRIISFMSLIGLISTAIATAEISYGVEALVSPLRRFGFPAGELGLIAMLIFRFIPILREESERLAKAQTARGGSLGFRSSNPLRRIRASIPIMIPLFLSTLRRAEILAESIHLRGFREDRNRIRLRRYSAGTGDWIWIGTALAVFLAAPLFRLMQIDSRIYHMLNTYLVNFWRIHT